jgi:hypothetical protein
LHRAALRLDARERIEIALAMVDARAALVAA